MSERAIKELKKKFVKVSMAAILVTMTMIAGLLYLGNTILNQKTIRNTLTYICDHDGDLIQWKKNEKEENKIYIEWFEKLFATRIGYQTPEFKFATRYFVIDFDANGSVTKVETSHIRAISEEEAQEYGELAFSKGATYGRVDSYYYKMELEDDGSGIVVYLDSSNVLRSNDRLLSLALVLIAFGMLLAFFIVRLLATRVIQTEVRNAELQKQFMTNASHELKTPLAVIRANTEMEELLSGQTEWTESTMRQIERLNGLIQNLVMVTRAEENSTHAEKEKIDATRAIQETVKNFESLATHEKKKLELQVDENVSLMGEEAQLRQLCSLLVDNAIKYCDEEGTVAVALHQKGKGVTFSVANDYQEGENVDYTKFFERFYREDQSHNVDRGGYGIGLSIAEGLVQQYRGSIKANWKDGKITFTCLLKSW